jgi:hypothetical protein
MSLPSLVKQALAQNPITIEQPRSAVLDLGDLISKGVTAAIIIAALATFAYLIWGGVEWLTSGGDKAKYEAARDRITAALIGLVIVLAAWAIMKLIGSFFGINITSLELPTVKTGQ